MTTHLIRIRIIKEIPDGPESLLAINDFELIVLRLIQIDLRNVYVNEYGVDQPLLLFQ